MRKFLAGFLLGALFGAWGLAWLAAYGEARYEREQRNGRA